MEKTVSIFVVSNWVRCWAIQLIFGMYQIPACLVTDSRNVYDKMETEVLSIKGAEKRTDISMLCLKEAQGTNEVEIRWVHSEAQLANGLTKSREYKQLSFFYDVNLRWRIVEDPERASARRRKAEGLGPLDNADRRKRDLGKGPEDPTEWPVVLLLCVLLVDWLRVYKALGGERGPCTPKEFIRSLIVAQKSHEVVSSLGALPLPCSHRDFGISIAWNPSSACTIYIYIYKRI